MKDAIEKRLVLGFGFIVIVSVAIAAIAVRNLLRELSSNDWVNHTHAVIVEVDAILGSLHAAEAAQRHFLITGDTHQQSQYRVGFAEAAEHLGVALTLTQSDAAQQARLRTLQTLFSNRVEFARSLVQLPRDARGQNAMRDLLLRSEQTASLTEMRRLVSTLREHENELLRQRDRQSVEDERRTRWVLVAGTGFNFLLLGLMFWLIRDDLRARRLAAEALQLANELLEAKVRERTAELVKTNEALKVENLERRWAHMGTEQQLQLLNLIQETVPIGLLVTTRDGSILQANGFAARLVGWTAKELAGKSLVSLLAEGTAETKAVLTAIKEGHVVEFAQADLVTRSASVQPASLRVLPVESHGNAVGTLVCLTAREKG